MAVAIEACEPRLFEFTIGGGEAVHSIPLAAYLPYGFMRKLLEEKDGERFAFALLDEFCPELNDDESLSLGTVQAIFDAWNEASKADGADAGE